MQRKFELAKIRRRGRSPIFEKMAVGDVYRFRVADPIAYASLRGSVYQYAYRTDKEFRCLRAIRGGEWVMVERIA